MNLVNNILNDYNKATLKEVIKGRFWYKEANAYAKQLIHEGYVRRMQSYLKTGDWADTLYGEHQEHKIKYRCVSLAYEKDGTPKRNIGTFYEDMGEVYTQEMFNEDRNSS